MKSLENTKTVGAVARRSRSHLALIMSTTALSAVVAVVAATPRAAWAQAAEQAKPQSVEEIVVTGSRIVREGYEAPTPLTVIGAEQLEMRATPNLMEVLDQMPALSGSLKTDQNIITAAGTVGVQRANLRSLGVNRTLVLMDGQRLAPATFEGVPDIGSIPQQLMSRVDVITGGAAAVYGSDAVAGVINFILDRDFTGVKGDFSGGMTNYGDGENYKIDLSAGFPFGPESRGHVLLSVEHLHNAGVQGSRTKRDWAVTGLYEMANPNYTATNGQPRYLYERTNAGLAAMTPGGLIATGPLKGIAFGEGGVPFTFRFGDIVSYPYMIGGDIEYSSGRQDYDHTPWQENQNAFARVSYDITDNVNAYVQYGFAQVRARTQLGTLFVLAGSAASPTIFPDNAFLPPSVRTLMLANNVPSFRVGSWNVDNGPVGNDNLYITNRVSAGLGGEFQAFDRSWTWNLDYGYGSTAMKAHVVGNVVLSRWLLATDAVVNPANGRVVCRVTLTDPNHPCRPWNPMGVGVNETNAPATDYVNQPNFQRGLMELTTYSGSVTGELFDVPAGPVSIALSGEHRSEVTHVDNDTYAFIADRPYGNVPSLNGERSVTEGAVEVIAPVISGGFVNSWEVTGAARATDYELSGYVTTWKLGTTVQPTDDVRFRLTFSRDIRAPTLQELFQTTQHGGGGAQVIDRFQNDRIYAIQFTNTSGNPLVRPEKANTIGVGAVLSPGFIEGFTVSADYWSVDIKDAIQSITTQQVIDRCFTGENPELCSDITRDAVGNIREVDTPWINLATRTVQGIDLEASYRMPVSNLVSDWSGDIALHGLATIYLKDYRDDTLSTPYDHLGETTGDKLPYWKFNLSATYSLDPIVFTLTARGVSSGLVHANYIECISGCPVSTNDNPTIDDNRVEGRMWLDAAVSYRFNVGDTSGTVYLSGQNILNKDPPVTSSCFCYAASASAKLFDKLGAVFRAGVRFEM